MAVCLVPLVGSVSIRSSWGAVVDFDPAGVVDPSRPANTIVRLWSSSVADSSAGRVLCDLHSEGFYGAVLFDVDDDDDSHVRVALVGTVAVPGPVNADDEMVAADEDAVWRTLVVFVQDAIVCYETDRPWGLVFFEVAWVLVVRFPSSYWRWPRLGLRNTMVFEAPPPQFPDEKWDKLAIDQGLEL